MAQAMGLWRIVEHCICKIFVLGALWRSYMWALSLHSLRSFSHILTVLGHYSPKNKKQLSLVLKIVYFCQNCIMTHQFSTWNNFKWLCFIQGWILLTWFGHDFAEWILIILVEMLTFHVLDHFLGKKFSEDMRYLET